MAKSVKDGSMSMDEFIEKSTKATTASSKFSRMAKTDWYRTEVNCATALI